MPKKFDYSSCSKEDLINRIYELEKRKKYGLVWDEEREIEKVVLRCKKELPVLKEVKAKEIKNNPDKPTHILIEGDNYHALSVLNYTHEKAIDVIYIDPPYNTGTKNWKYNNNYVDKNDAWRHSKWIQFMYNRLLLAKNLLTENGSLICAIDDNEFAQLGLLFDEVFPSYEKHSITIVHNPRGVQGTNFSYTHEYSYFIIPKGMKTIGARKISEKEISWSKLRNWGGESLREDAKNCFYPIIIDPKFSNIIGFGEVCNDSFHPSSPNVKNGDEIWVYPIDNKGVERKRRYARQSVESIKHLLRARKINTVWQIEIGKTFGTYKTVWDDPKYDANEYGTKLISKMVPNCDFDFPKSLYNVYDCIYAVVENKKNAIILDYFAGSGTTGHATLLLNSEDGGSRQFILCTNNENKIAESVTYPRLKSAINGYQYSDNDIVEGLPGNIKYYQTDFISAETTDINKEKLTKQSIEMLCLRENTFEPVLHDEIIKIFQNKEKYTAILFDQRAIPKLKNIIKDYDKPIHIYIFSLGDDDFADEFQEMQDKVKVCSIPAAILRVYRRIFK